MLTGNKIGIIPQILAIYICFKLLFLSEAFSLNSIRNIGLSSQPTFASKHVGKRFVLTKQNALKNDQEDKTDDEREEEARMKVLASRRKTIRSTLKSAESLKNFRIMNGMLV